MRYPCIMTLQLVRRRPVRIAVLGAVKVGKTACVTRFLDGNFSSDYDPTHIEHRARFIRTTDGSLQYTEITDMSGRKEMTALHDTNIKDANAFLVVYSVDNKKSLKRAIKICHRVFSIHGLQVPLVLLGNQTDLKAGDGMRLTKRVKFVQRKFQCFHMEASTKRNENVKEVFDGLIELARSKAVIDYLEEMRLKTSARALQSYYCDFMPPQRISKFAIPELMEQEAKRLERSQRVTESSCRSGRSNSIRSSRVSNSTSNAQCLPSSDVDKRKKLIHSQPLSSHHKFSINCRSRGISSVSMDITNDDTICKLSRTAGDRKLGDEIPDNSARKLSLGDSAESITGELLKDKFAQPSNSLLIPNNPVLAEDDKESKEEGVPNTCHRRRKNGVSYPKPLNTCIVIPVDDAIETVRASREQCIAEQLRLKKRKSCSIM